MDRAQVLAFLIAIEKGEADEFLEQILTAAHNRKNVVRRGRSSRF